MLRYRDQSYIGWHNSFGKLGKRGETVRVMTWDVRCWAIIEHNSWAQCAKWHETVRVTMVERSPWVVIEHNSLGKTVKSRKKLESYAGKYTSGRGMWA